MPIVLRGNDPITIVSFASLGAEQFDDIKLDEFRKTLSSFDCDQIYVSDLSKSWYCRGITDVSFGLEGAVDFLKKEIKDNKTIFMGHSMGGFGAGIYGMMCNADVVLAFSPQTYIADDDPQYKLHMRKIHVKWSWLDFRNNGTELVVINNFKSAKDTRHMEFVDGMDNVVIVDAAGSTHNTAKELKQKKKLVPFIKEYYDKLLGDVQ